MTSRSPLSPGAAGVLALFVLGGAIRIACTVTFDDQGDRFDLRNLKVVARGLRDHGLYVYGAVASPDALAPTYPAPPGYFPWLWAVGPTEQFATIIRLGPIAADLVLVLLVDYALRLGERSDRERILAAGLIALNPILILVSAVYGQIDSISFSLATAGLIVWWRELPRRAVLAGLLIGAGACVKAVPIVLLLACVPTARSRREFLLLSATAGAAPLTPLLPFLVADFDAVRHALSYHGLPGQAGLSILLQPGLIDFSGEPLGPVASLVQNWIFAWLAVALGSFTYVMWRRRSSLFVSATGIVLIIYLIGGSWFTQYAIWAVPFLLLVSKPRWVLALTAIYLMSVPSVLGEAWSGVGLDGAPSSDVGVLAAWLMWAAWLAVLGSLLFLRTDVLSPRRHP